MENPFDNEPFEETPEPVQQLMDEVSLIGLKEYYDSQEPHKYVDTEPYNGCGQCGIGPGAWFHGVPAHESESQD